MTRRNVVSRMIGWLRQGYPHGVPQADYVALFGILHRDLTDAEIEQVVRALREDASYPTANAIPEDRIAEEIQRLVHEAASESDIKRVSIRLVEGGWPLASVDDDDVSTSEQSEPSEPSEPSAAETTTAEAVDEVR